MLRTLFALAVLAVTSARAESPNLLRNGSFEGCLLYWHGIEPGKHTLVKDAKNGTYALHSTEGNIMSAPWVAERGKDYTVSFWVKGDNETEVRVQMPPSAREVGTNAKRLWVAEATKSAKVMKEWQRVSFTWKADVPPDGFWPLPHYMVQIEGKGLFVDGVTVQEGTKGAADYVPRAAVEVLAECPDLPGYAVNGNVLPAEATVRIRVHASNTGSTERKVVLNCSKLDYDGRDGGDFRRRLAWLQIPAAGRRSRVITLPPGTTRTEELEFTLSWKGCVLAAATADTLPDSEKRAETTLLDSCEIPLTTLPYPAAATKPDYRERFGGSFAGGTGMVKRLQAIGMRWIRWRPHSNGADHLPEKPADLTKPDTWKWTWFDMELAEQEAHGFSSHLVLYPPPLWIMEKEHGGHPLPTDMRWKADDPRWDDLSVKTVWDHFVEQAVRHYKDRAVVFEIENEPEFDRWMEMKLGGEYAKFTMRTARLIKATAPAAKVMVNNVYGIPSPVNGVLFAQKDGLKNVDILSWHDYHAGWLADAMQIKRFRQSLDEAGGKHVAIWFNEGWAFTNTAVDEPPACTGLTSAQSTNAIMASVAEMTVSGQDKTILFHTGYEDHGMSFWDYSGPGTCLWDWYGNPLPLVAAWNVMAHHISLSEPIGLIRPPGCNLAVFQDLRNNRGVIVAYADRDAKEDAMINLGMSLTREDLMGNVSDDSWEPPKIAAKPAPRPGKPQPPQGFPVKPSVPGIFLSKTGRLLYLYDDKTTGKELYAALEKLDRKHQGFATGGKDAPVFQLPATWEGTAKGKPDGNPATADGKPIWALYRLWPTDPMIATNWTLMQWEGTQWQAPDHSQGGHPSATLRDGVLGLGVLGPWGGNDFNYPKMAALAFIAPEPGKWRLTAKASAKPWEGGAKVFPLALLKKDTQRAAELKRYDLPRDGTAVTLDFTADLAAGHELLLAPQMQNGMDNNAANLTISEISVRKE